jgi:hypothetical protein
MSTYEVNRFLYTLENDPAFPARAQGDLTGALASFRLTPDEAAAITSGDVATLYRQGVHPFLLNRLAAFGINGLTREQYGARIRTVKE